MEQDRPAVMPAVENSQQNHKKGWQIATAVVSILAISGIGFGVYGMMQSSQKDHQIAELKVQAENNQETETTKTPQTEAQPGESNTIADSSNLSAEELSHYIYIAQWGLKIAFPASLSSLSYQYYMSPGYTSLGVSGVNCAAPRECQYMPDFADSFKTRSSLD